MMHCGYEASAVEDTFSNFRGFLATVRATLFGPKTPSKKKANKHSQAPLINAKIQEH